MADYKIELGVKLNTSDLQTQVNQAGDNIKPIDIKVDAETKELTRTINEALKKLSNGTENALTINTSKLEGSIEDVKKDVVELKTLFNNLGNNADMKSLVSSVNQIATALGKAEKESDNLVNSLNALSKKDFSINLNLKAGNANPVKSMADYGDAVRDSVIPQLEERARYLQKALGGFDKAQSELSRLMTSKYGQTGAERAGKLFDSLSDDSSLNKQMNAYKKYISYMQEIVSKKNSFLLYDYNLEFPISPEELIADAKKIQSGTKDVEESFEKLKQVIGGGVDAEGLGQVLEPLLEDVKEIRAAFEGLSSIGTIDGLTTSFKELSEVLDKLVSNINLAKQALGDGLDGAGGYVDDNGTEKAVQDQKELSQAAAQSANTVAQAEEKKQQAYRETADAAEQVSKIRIGNTELDALNLKDDIDEADRLAAALSKLKSIQSSIDNIEIGEIDISKGAQEIQTLERQLESLSNEYNETVAEINGMGGVSASQLQSFKNDIDNTNRKIEQLQSNLREKIQTAIGTNVARDVQKAHSEFDKLSSASTELRQKLQSLDDIKVDLDTEKEHGDVQKLSELYTRYLKVLKEVNTQLDIQKRTENDTHRNSSFELDREKAMHRLKTLFTDNSEAARKFGSELDRLQRELNECGDTKGLQRINKEIDNLGSRVKEANVKTQTFGDKLKKQFSQYSSYLSVASLFMYAEQGLRSMFEQVKLIDSAMTELKKVTDETDASYNQFLSNAASRAQEIGTTIDGLVSSTADFARLGYDFVDAQGLAEVANIYAVVGDEIEGVEGATESLISTMAAFKDSAKGMSNSDFAMSIIDKFNEIGNNFAISSGGIGEALERSASSLMAANATLDESVALITASNQVVQDPVAVGE